MPTNDIRIKRLYDTMARHYNMTEPFEEFADKFIGSEQARRKVYDAMARHYNMTESFEDFSKIATDGSFSGSQTRLNSSDDKKYQKQKITQENASGYPQIGSNDKHTDKVYKETEAKEENKPASVSATGLAKRDPVLLAEEDFKRSKDSLLSRLIPSGDENFYTKLSEKEREVYWQRYQELEDNYKKEKKTSKEWAEANTWIKDELKEQRKEERKDKWKNLGKGLIRSIAYPAGTATGSVSYKLTAGDTPAQAQAKEWAEPYMKEYRESKAVARVLDESVKLFNAAEKGKGVGRGIIDDMAKIQTWDLGLSDMSHQMTLGTLYEKEERGEPLTATENEVLDAVAIASYVTEQVSPAVKRGYNVGASLPQSLGFMFSLYINPASGLGKTVASRAIRRYGRRGVSKLTTRAIGTGARVFGDIAEMGIATATSGSGRVLAEAIERVNGSPTYEISPEGFVVYGGQRDKEEFGRAYAKAFGSNYIENWSEAVGDYFLPLIKPLDTTLKNVIDVKLRKKNLNGIADFLNSVPKSQLAGMVNDFKERTKFSGLIGEILEEEIGMLVEPLLIGDTTLKENFGVWSKDPQIRETARDNQLTTIFSCALMSGALGAVQVAGGRVAAKMDKDVRKAHQEGQRLFKKDWTDIKDRIDEAEPDQVVSITKDIAFNPNLSVEQRKAVVEYAYKRMINQQYNTTAKLARDEMTQTAQTLLTAYDAGYRMATASHPKGIRKAYIEAIEAAEALQQYDKNHYTDLFSTAEKLLTADMATRQMTLDGLGREQSELVEDYLAKTLRQTGIEDGTTDDVQDTVEAALSALDPVTTHDEQGNPVIITALTADDRVVYITGEQDKMSTITYEDTNETTVYPTDQLKDHVVQSKEDVINEFEAQIRERSRARLTHYSQHNDKTQPIQKGLVIGDGDAKIIVTDTGAGWATIQEAETDKESGQIVPKKDAPTRDVTHDYLLSLQDDIYDHRDMMDGMNQMAQMVAQEIKQAQQDTGVAPSDQEALRSRIAEWEERTGVKAIIATTIDEVTSKSAQEAITEGRIVNAWYEVETDRVGFYLPYIASVKEIDTGYMHEVVSHKGLRELLGQEKFDTLMDAVWRDLMTEEDRTNYLHYNRHLNLEGADAQRAAADEYVARVAESVDATEPTSNITEAWNKIVEYVRGILEELGLIDNTLTNDELSDVIKASLLNYEHKQLQARQLSEQQAQAQAEQQAKAQEQAGEEALSKIPPIQNKQGETIDYEWAKAPDIETALTAMRHLGYTNQDIVQFALTYTDTLVGRHKKLEKRTPKSLPEQKAKRENIQAIAQELSFWRGVRDQIQKETTPEIESRPRDVQEQTNIEGIEGIAKRFNEGKRTRGIETTVILADGTEISGHYELTEAGDVTASHNPETFEQSEGFPTNENGSTVNDRDYQHDKAAQEAVKLKGQSYDKRAYQEPVIVSPDGVVYSGNDRTMAGIIAANNGADVKYNESLRQDIAQYGFTEEQFNEYKHPRLVFVTAETLPYTTETFARFNASERKSQDSTEKMVKSGKTTSGVTFQRLADLVQMYDDVFEMYNKGGAEIINLLIKEGVITSNDAAQHLDGDKLSRTGQEFVESLIIGYLFNQNDKTVRMLFADGMGNVRKAIIGSLSQLIVNRTMGEYSIQPEMEQAIEICYRAHRDHSGSVEGFLSQINLFTDDVNSKESSELAQQIALSINTGSVRLRGALDVYNKSFANDVGAVAGVFGKRTRDEALQDLTNYLKRYDTEEKTRDVPEGITGDRRDDTGSSDQSGADDRGAAETTQRRTDTDSPADNEESRGEQVSGVEKHKQESYKKEASRLSEMFGVDIEVHENLDGVSKDVRKQIESGGRTPGWYQNGKVHIYLPHTISVKDLQQTFFHEVIAHKGMRELLGDRFNDVILDFFDKLPKEVQEQLLSRYKSFDVYKDKTDQELRVIAADEFIASVAENGEFMGVDQRTVLQRIVDAIKKFFNANNIEVQLADVERLANDYLRQSAENLQNKNRPRSQNSAEDIAFRHIQATIDIDGIERSTTNSEGKPIAQTEEGIRNFWRWFGDSKVVDAEGRPLVVYHATQSDFNEFKTQKIGTSVDFGTLGSGFYFTTSAENASNYARNLNTNTGKQGGESIMPVYLKINNPYDAQQLREVSGDSKKESENFTNKNKKKGHDGAKFEWRSDFVWYVAYNPNQIKSAIGNTGSFDPNSNDIRFRTVDKSGFYSTVESALEGIKQNKGTPSQFKAMLLKNGAKQAELDWMGWDDQFPDATKKVSKEKQLDIIQSTNPMRDDIHVGIRKLEDIKTFDQVVDDPESFVYGDFSKEDAQKALKEGSVTVYSSTPIKNGAFVSTSEKQAKDYAGNGKVYSQKVSLGDVAWINGDEGQMAKADNTITKSEIQDWIDQNRIEVEEVEKGAPSKVEVKSIEPVSEKYATVFTVTFSDNSTVEVDLSGKYGNDPSDISEREIAEEAQRLRAEDDLTYEGDEVIRPTKYSQYTLPGGMNYRELLLTMPTKETGVVKERNDYIRSLVNKYDKYNENQSPLFNFNRVTRFFATEEEKNKLIELNGKLNKSDQKQPDTFKSSHFNEPNILAHIRFNEREVNGERVLFIEEIQSDWAQEGKKKGFKQSNVELRPLLTTEELDITQSEHQYHTQIDGKTYDVGKGVVGSEEAAKQYFVNWLNKEIAQSNDRIQTKNRYATPDMPFKKTDQWVNLALRRMMMYAAENGFDRIAWTTGQQQADRYDLSKHVRSIDWEKNYDGTYDVQGNLVGGGYYTKRKLDAKGIADNFGKEISEKITSSDEKEGILKGLDLKVGGEGMKAFYDQIIPKAAKKLAKPFGAKVETIQMPLNNVEVKVDSLPNEVQDLIGNYEDGEIEIDELSSELDKLGYEYSLGIGRWIENVYKRDGGTFTFQSIPITDELREMVPEGMPLFRTIDNVPSDNQQIFDAAKEKFGTTLDMREAGYILPDGSMLDFSGKHEVRGADTSFLDGERTVDHRGISDIAYDFDGESTGVKTDMADFLDRGAIRIDYDAGAINLNVAPTKEQKDRLRRLIERNRGDVYIDFGKGWDTEHYVEYEGARASRVLADIDRYYSEGIKPGGTVMFRDVYGGNSGYIGYSMSRRAAQARSEGRYPKTDFKKVYGLSEKVFKRLVDAGVLNDSEWHHTSMYGNRTTFYSWDGDHYHDIYEQNRDRVDKLIADNKLDELYDFFYNEDRRITEEWENSTERRTDKARIDIAREYNRYQGTQVNMLTKDVYEASNGMTVVPKHVGNYKDVRVEVGGIELTRKSGGEERRKAIREYRDYIESNILPYSEWLSANMENIGHILEKHGITESDLIASIEDNVRFRERTDAPPKNIGKAYKVFKLINGKLYPPMVANPNAEHTPMGVWLDADASPVVGTSKTGRPHVKAAGGGRLAFRPGWHLGTIPYASQFNRKDADGNMTLFPANFVWAEVEYAKDIDYQKEAKSYGISESGKFRHSYAGLPRIPENGSYLYRTNPNPKTDTWIITGAMKVNKLLTASQVDALVIEAGREPQKRQDGFITSEQIRAFNRVNKAVETGDNTLFRVIGEIGVSRLDGAEKILDNLRVAKQMEIRPDISLNEIKLTTGWERGADRKWRYEQPDGKPITENLYSPEDGVMTTHESDEDAADIANAPKLSEVWDDAELFKTYPKIADIKVIGIYGHVVDKPSGIYGTEKGVKVINAVAPDADAWRMVMVHEIQHAIQDIEGFARGGDHSIIERGLVSVRDTQTAETLNPYTAYRRLAGEVEARNVSRRRDFTAEERRRMLLEDSEDVERSQQIVLRGVAEDTMFREADISGEKFGDSDKTATFVEENSKGHGTGEAIQQTLQFKGEGATYTDTAADDIQRKGSAEPDTRNIRTEAGAGALIRPLRKLEKGEMCFVQRKMSEDKNFSFTGANQIESTEDVAYIFKQLENKAVENAFLVFIKDGKATVLHVGMGNLSGTIFDTVPIAVMLSNIKPDTVYMVHNHPSGNVVASDQDHKIYNDIKRIVKTHSPKTKLGEGIIIDTKSGIYGIFGESPTEKKEAAKKPLYETNIPVYKFDELAFSKDYDPLKLTRIKNSLDIANFVATHRLGERDKVNILCINTSGHVVGNFFTDITTLKSNKDAERLAGLCAEYVGMTGARSVAVFGSGVAPANAAKGAELKYWHKFRYAARNMQVSLLDIISVDNLYGTHSSYADNHLMETTAAYGEQEREESTEVEDVRFNETRRERKERLESDWELLKKEQGLAVATYDRRLADTAVKVYEATTDNCQSVKELQKAVTAETGKTLKSYENVYWLKLDETSRTQPAQWNFARFFYEPLTDEVRRIIQSNTTGIVGYRKAYKELSDYLMAKHGLERNDKFAMRDAQKAFEAYEKAHPNTGKTVEDFYADFRKRDYSGLTALTDKKKTEDAEAMAQAMVEAYESANDTKELWRLINRCTKEILRISYNGSMISKQTYIDLVTMFDYYIPLRGFDETTSDEVYSYVGTVNSPYNTAIKSARGRRSRAEDPLATIGNMADSEIINVHKNVAKRALLSLAENHRTNLLSVSEVMYVKDANTGNWVMSMPLFDDGDTAEEVTAKMIEHRHWFAAQMMIDPDNYKMGTDAINIPYKVVSSKALSEHQVLVTRGGQKYIVTINGNPRAAQAINGKLNPDAYYSALSPIRAANRFIAKMVTQYNPEFVFSNLTRDGHYANTMVWVRENRDYAEDYNKNWVVSFKDTPRLLQKYKNGTLDTSVPIERYYKEFIEHGGETGYTRLLSVTDYKKQMERKLRGASRHSPLEVANKVVGGYLDTIEDLNRWAEGVSRFAAFLTSRVHGRDIIRSVHDAKEITVNFNRKGAGTALMKAGEKNAAAITAALVTQFGREGYVFFNASIQALDNYAKAGKKNPGKFTSLVIGNIMTGFVMAMLYGDDDDYLNLPPYVRRNNLCAKVDGKWVTIPLSHEHRGFFGLGELAYMVMSGREFYDDNELMTEILSQFSQMLPVDFLESNEADLVMTMMPTSVRPAVEAYVNKDWTGSPIYSDSPYNEHDPEWRKAFRYTSPTLVSATRKLSDATGGSVGRGGSINLNPAIIEHLFESYLGGVGTTFNKAYKTVRAIAGDKQMQEIRNVPVVSRFVRQTDGQAAARAENSRYYDVRDYVEGIINEERRLRQMAAEKEITGLDYDADDIAATIQKLQELRASNKWAFVQRWKALDKARSAAQEAGEEEQVYNITKQANDLYKELRRSKMEDEPVGTTK